MLSSYCAHVSKLAFVIEYLSDEQDQNPTGKFDAALKMADILSYILFLAHIKQKRSSRPHFPPT